MPGPLEGVRIVDLSSGIAGPMATMVLADQGAEVIKVEPPDGDPMRAYAGYVVWNRGKRSVVLDLHRDDARKQFRDLVATADVLVESFSPGTMAEWELDFESLSADLPGLVYCSITGYGRDNRAADRPAYDLLVQARSGQQWEQPGWREGPTFLYMPMPSVATSYLALEAVAAALYVREVTGRGQWVETSLYQGVLAFTTQLRQDIERAESIQPIGAFGAEVQSKDAPTGGIYQCADGQWVHSMHNAGGRGKDRGAIWSTLGIEPIDITPFDPQGAAEAERAMREAILRVKRDDLLAGWWAGEIPVAPVRHAAEAFDDPQLAHNGMIVEVDDPEHGLTRQAGVTFRLNGAPRARVQGPQPRLGQHTGDVLSTLGALPARAREARVAKRPLRHALEGIKVLDFGNFLAGPFAAMLLADLGATVYKLESPEGDQMRFARMPFNGCQRGKLDIAVDLKTPEGLEIAHRLAREVDVVHHNNRPGVAERLGMDYATLSAINPSLVYCHTTMWGPDGPRASWPGFDQLGQASCGCEIELGGEGNPPMWYRFGMCDAACACQSAVGVLLALYWREKTGQGQVVDTSIVNGGMYYNSDLWIGADGPSWRPQLDNNQTGFGPLYRLYETADGWIAVACIEPGHWDALVRTVADGQLDTDPRFATPAGRAEHATELGAVLERVFAADTAASWFQRLDAGGVPVEISDPDARTSWFTDPEAVANGLVAEYHHAEYGRMRQFGHLVHLSETPGAIGGPPPLLGEHSQLVLAELGYSADEIAELRARGVTTWPE
jgi:crotonobetainyl-CoA:carnitine CoA-transferase CaiB-like acyl-CoA transferase